MDLQRNCSHMVQRVSAFDTVTIRAILSKVFSVKLLSYWYIYGFVEISFMVLVPSFQFPVTGNW